jgi:hypothetical protein
LERRDKDEDLAKQLTLKERELTDKSGSSSSVVSESRDTLAQNQSKEIEQRSASSGHGSSDRPARSVRSGLATRTVGAGAGVPRVPKAGEAEETILERRTPMMTQT